MKEIDLEQFEGHTKGPWILCHTASRGPTIAGRLNDVDWELIRSAPDLLEEVKRLRERIKPSVPIFDFDWP